MKQELKHIFEISACLSRRQMRDYVADSMSKEEFHAVEHHISSCPFCSEALAGVMLQKEPGMAVTIEALGDTFLNEHFAHIHPQIHLNSLGPAHAMQKRKANVQPLGYTSIAVAVLLGAGLLWFLQQGRSKMPVRKASVNTATETAISVTDNKKEQKQPARAVALPTKDTTAPATNSGFWDTGSTHK